MVEVNELTIFTDFDKTMVKQNSPIRVIVSLFFRHPFRTTGRVLVALRRFGLSGTGFIYALASVERDKLATVANKVVKRLKLNQKWVAHLQNLVKKHHNIRKIR